MSEDAHTAIASSKVGNREVRLAECYQRGLALAASDRDYAHAMFAECVCHAPGNFQFVEAMVRNLRAQSPKAGRRFFKMGRRKIRALEQAFTQKDWKEVFRRGIERLAVDPWEVSTLRVLAEACEALHYNEAELVYLKQALDAEPENPEVNRHCATSLARMGQFDQSIACWHRVEKLRGKDAEAMRMISQLAEEKLKYPGGRPPAAQPKAVPLEEPEEKQPASEIVLSPRQKLEQAIERDPKIVGNYLELAELLLESSQLSAAEAVLARGLAACGEQRDLVEHLEQVRKLQAEEQRQFEEDRLRLQEIENTPFRIPWLEIGLVATMALLALQLIPAFRTAAWSLIDFSQWSQFGWIGFNVVVLVGLVFARFAPDLVAYAHERQKRRMRRAMSRSR